MQRKLKKPTTYPKQVKLLKKKNILVEDDALCEDFLAKVNYYRLSGYFLPFINRKKNFCEQSISFEQIQNIYYFDTELRNLLSIIIERVEIFIRSQLAYYNAHHYGADGYMDSQNYNSRHNYKRFTAYIKKSINDNAKSPVIQHHLNEYGGKFPIWVIIEYFTLGTLSFFYTGMKNHDKASIALKLYSTNYQCLSSWLKCLTDLRNRCAHYSRLYYWKYSTVPKLPKSSKVTADHTLFSQLYMLKLMYPEPENWNDDFIKPFHKIYSKYKKHISRTHMGLPYKWKSILKN